MDEKAFLFYELLGFLFFYVFQCGVTSLMEMNFFSRFLNCEARKIHYIFYMLIIYFSAAMEAKLLLAPISLLVLVAEISVLAGIGILCFRLDCLDSLLAAVLTKMVMLLSNGVICPITFLIVSQIIRFNSFFLVVVSFCGALFSLLFTFFCYQFILKKFAEKISFPSRYYILFYVPVLLVLLIERYIFNEVYGNELIVEDSVILKPHADHWQMLLIQLFAFFSLFCILYACRKLSEDFANRTRLALLEQATHTQEEYVKEAKLRYDQTRAFRHDVKNHLMIVEGLLEKHQIEEACQYLKKMEDITASLSFPCHTNRPVLDILLSGKLGFASQNGIRTECLIEIPEECAVDDPDLCILFANALDNAIKACIGSDKPHNYIRVSGKRQGDFFMVEFENGCAKRHVYPKGAGIGLSNIRAVAEKYHGAISTEKQRECFRLNILLIISQHRNDIP